MDCFVRKYIKTRFIIIIAENRNGQVDTDEVSQTEGHGLCFSLSMLPFVRVLIVPMEYVHNTHEEMKAFMDLSYILKNDNNILKLLKKYYIANILSFH